MLIIKTIRHKREWLYSYEWGGVLSAKRMCLFRTNSCITTYIDQWWYTKYNIAIACRQNGVLRCIHRLSFAPCIIFIIIIHLFCNRNYLAISASENIRSPKWTSRYDCVFDHQLDFYFRFRVSGWLTSKTSLKDVCYIR